MRTFRAVALLLAFILTSCEGYTSTPAYPTLAPTPALEPASEITPGESRVPTGKYPFIEAWVNVVGYSLEGECFEARMIDFPTYSFHDGKLSGLDRPDGDMIGFFGMGTSNSGAMGGGVDSVLNEIEQLPFALPGNKSIQSILEDGTLAFQLPDGQTYWLHPGQSWIEYFERDPDPTCHIISTMRLTNFGLLGGENIIFDGTPLAPAKTLVP